MINLYITYQTKSEPFYNFFLVDHIADKDIYNHTNYVNCFKLRQGIKQLSPVPCKLR